MTYLADGTIPRFHVRVWDVGVRLFHWSLVSVVAAAWIFDEPRSLHRSLGYTMVALVSFRLVWGLVGSRHARFANFVPGPRRLIAYLRDIAQGRESRYLGHNPAGGAMIVALIATLASIATTGYMMGMDAWFGVEWVETAHKTLVNGLGVLIALHLGGVITASLRHRENLVLAMITGEKAADPPHVDF